MNFSAAHGVEGTWELAQKTSDDKSYYFVTDSVSKHPKATEWLHCRFGVNKEGP